MAEEFVPGYAPTQETILLHEIGHILGVAEVYEWYASDGVDIFTTEDVRLFK